jgi:tetratricopeptide (TPR) repeat protein
MYLRGETVASVTQLDAAIQMLDENGLTAGSSGQDVDMLRAFANMIKNQKDTPEESLQLLLRATTWDSVVVILNARRGILLDPALDAVLMRAIASAQKRGETLFAKVMRIYQRLLTGCRDKGTESTLRRERATFVDTTIELWWGYIHRCNRQHTAALTHFNHVLQNNPDDRTALIERGWIYRKLGRYEQALDDFRQVDGLQNRDALALQGMGVVQFDLGRPDESLATLTLALQRREEPNTYHWRAAVYQAMRDLPAALADLDRAIKLAPRSSDHYYWRSLVYLQSKDYARAKSDLGYVIEMEAEDKARLAYTHFWRGIAHDLMEDRAEARGDWAQAREDLKLAIDPIVHWLNPLLLLVEDRGWNQAQESYARLLKSPFTQSVLLAQARNLRLLQLLYPQSENIQTTSGWLSQRSQGNAKAP